MNLELRLASLSLKEIIENDVNFKDAVKRITETNKAINSYASVTSLVGCELRHHLLVSYLTKDMDFGEFKYLVYIALANHFFLKKVDDSEVYTALKQILAEKFTSKLDELFKFEGSAFDLIKELDNEDLENISVRFNIPTYLLKMWFKHYGRGLTFKSLKKYVRPSEMYFSVNEGKISKEKFIEKYKDDFEETVVPNSYRSLDKNKVRKLDCYNEFQIYSIRLALKSILNKIDYTNVEEIALYSGSDDSIIRDIFYTTKMEKGIHLIVPNMDKRADILRLIRVNKAKNINYFEMSDFTNLPAHISDPLDLVIVYPNSSSFDKIQSYPDYLLHFKQDSFDSLIANEKEVLKGMASLVAVEGKLVYIVDTLNRKESLSIINEFLSNNRNFELIEQCQIFPSSNLDGTFYYAIIERKS